MEEVWKKVKGSLIYEVSNIGRVRSIPRNINFSDGRVKIIDYYKILKSCANSSGHFGVVLYENGKSRSCKVHRLVAESFIPNPNNLPIVNHIDGNKENNDVSNLEWSTLGDNARHAIENGLVVAKKGEDHSMSKVTEKEVREIRDKYKPRVYSYQKLAKEYGVSASNISSIVLRKSWKHID